jgi:hypothetical protein
LLQRGIEAMTERQAVVQHFVDKDVKVGSTIDMAVYLAGDQQQTRPQLADQKEYVEKVLKAGYTSTLAKQLFEDIKKSQADQPETEADPAE